MVRNGSRPTRARSLGAVSLAAVSLAALSPAALSPAAALLAGHPAVTAAQSSADDAAITAGWKSSWYFTQAYTPIEGSFTVSSSGQRSVVVHLEGARFLALPSGCYGSSTVNPRSSISAGVDTLDCWLQPDGGSRTIDFEGLVVAEPGQVVRGTVQVKGGGPSAELPPRVATRGTPPRAASLRLLSSPDFLNADVGDLAKGPGFWSPARTENSINDDYRRALDTVLDDWKSLSPDAVLVAGDLVDGWWGTDSGGSGNFGPVDTPAQERRALARAADTYYPQWLRRFTSRGLDVLPAMGDHEYGDDPWPSAKRGRARAFEQEYAQHLGRLPERFSPKVSRPPGVHHTSAYALRPRPDVQLVTLNVFDITPQRQRIRLDPAQMRWLRTVLAKARRDRVRWVIVQGHTPILWPVRVRGSSGLHYEGGARSELWKVFQKYGVDLYLAGEVHDVTAVEQDGITQITHGGAFQFGLTNYLVLDLTPDYAYLTLRDYDFERSEAPDGSRLWETRPSGMPKNLRISPDPLTIGTGVLLPDGELTRESGALKPWNR
jgi:hypothetical protein